MDLVRGLALAKVAAARANAELGELHVQVAEAIVAAAREVAEGRWAEHFPIALVHGGGGTPANMNVNEVLANRAGELLGSSRGTYDRVHRVDHVNRSQSSNDVYPTALQIAVLGRGSGRRGPRAPAAALLANEGRREGSSGWGAPVFRMPCRSTQATPTAPRRPPSGVRRAGSDPPSSRSSGCRWAPLPSAPGPVRPGLPRARRPLPRRGDRPAAAPLPRPLRRASACRSAGGGGFRARALRPRPRQAPVRRTLAGVGPCRRHRRAAPAGRPGRFVADARNGEPGHPGPRPPGQLRRQGERRHNRVRVRRRRAGGERHDPGRRPASARAWNPGRRRRTSSATAASPEWSGPRTLFGGTSKDRARSSLTSRASVATTRPRAPPSTTPRAVVRSRSLVKNVDQNRYGGPPRPVAARRPG